MRFQTKKSVVFSLYSRRLYTAVFPVLVLLPLLLSCDESRDGDGATTATSATEAQGEGSTEAPHPEIVPVNGDPSNAADPAAIADPELNAAVAISFLAPDDGDEFAQNWATVEERLQQQPGYMRAIQLATTTTTGPFPYINVALWESEAAIEAAVFSDSLRGLALSNDRASTAWYRPIVHRGDITDSFSGATVFIAPFVVDPSRVEEFLASFDQAIEFFASQPGFEALALLQKQGGTAPYEYVLVARWQTALHLYAATHADGFRTAVSNVAGASIPGTYVQRTEQ